MNTADLLAELESRYACVQGPFRRVCQTGEAYVTIGFEDWDRPTRLHDKGLKASLGPRVPGVIRWASPRRHHLTEDEACQDFLKAFALYERHWRDGHPGGAHPVLYWRYDPQIHWYPDERAPRQNRAKSAYGAIKCRLVLSNLPVVEVSDADYDAARTSQLERELLGGTNG